MKSFAAAPLEHDEWVFDYRFLAPDDALRMPLAYCIANRWGCLLTTLRQEPQNVEIMVNACITLYNMLRTAGADDAGCWHTQQSASVGISSHVLVISKVMYGK